MKDFEATRNKNGQGASENEATCEDAPVEDSCDGAADGDSVATSQSAQASEMGSSANQAPNWEDLKKNILKAIKNDQESHVF